MITYSDVQNHVATSILFRHDTLAANVGRPVRSEHQTVYRLTPKNLQDFRASNGKTRSTMDYLEVKAIYLGKYFVGDVKDFIPESFWTNPANTANMVGRRYFIPGAYAKYRYQGSAQFQLRSVYTGSEACYWMLAANQWQADWQGKWLASPSMGDVGTYGAELANWQALDDVWSYRVLQLYSTTYQGNNWK